MKTHQFTVRQVSDSVSRALRRRAKERNVSLNRLLVEALEVAAGVSGPAVRYHDLDALAGSWVSDPATDRALLAQRSVDEKDWR
jgi:hypothetical protein